MKNGFVYADKFRLVLFKSLLKVYAYSAIDLKGYHGKFWCFDVVEKVKTSLVWILERKGALNLWHASVFV